MRVPEKHPVLFNVQEKTMLEQAQNLNQAILAAMDVYSDKTCFKVKRDGTYADVSYQEFEQLTFRMARFLQSQGISSGERVALACENCLEWMVVYVATLLAGGIAVPLPPSITLDTLRFTLQDSGASLVMLDDRERITTILELLDAEGNELPDLQSILVIGQVQELSFETIPISTVLLESNPPTPEEIEPIRAYALSTAPETLASIHYTAGETGRLKGAVFDHYRTVKTMQHLAAWLKLEDDDLAFTVMSWGNSSSLAVALNYFLAGVGNILSEESVTAIPENMRLTTPTISLNMPHFFERFYDAVMEGVAREPESSQKVFQWAVAKGKEYLAAGPDASPELRQEYARADLTFFNQIRGYVGGRIRRMISAGAPLPQKLVEFFTIIGLPVINTYSVTEAGGFPFVCSGDILRPSSCGQLAPGFEARLADDGELLIRGETLMCEYWGWPAEMQQAIDPEGWLHTGDTGYLDEDGYLYLIGHKQPLMTLTTGYKIMPATIEQALRDNPYIAQATVFGEGRPYVCALIVPNLDALSIAFEQTDTEDEPLPELAPTQTTTTWFWRQGDDEGNLMTTTAHPRVQALLHRTIGQVNSRLEYWERVRAYSLLEQADSEVATALAEALAKGRHVVAERYCAEIERMYPAVSSVSTSSVTQVMVSPERLQTLLEKENILDAWLADAGIQFLFDLARDKQIDAPSMVHISDTAATIAQMEAEEKPLSTALIVGDPIRIARTLPQSQVQLLRHDHIRRMRHILVTLAKMVDGLVLGYVIDKYGYVRGIHRLSVDLDEQPVSFLLGPQFRHHAAISQQCDAVVFFVPSGGRQVRVFANGQLLGRYSNGDWAPENIAQVDKAVAELAQGKQYDPALIRRVLRCAFQMSEENMGAIFIIGNAEVILDHSDAPETSHFALLVSDEIANLSDRELINFAKQDGATVIDVQGKFRGCMVLLRPDAGTQAEIGAGKGARHSSAAKMSAEATCLAITVSQDGPITVYDSGQRVLSL
jgi:long-chain acyl-CoA synthetase